MQTKLERYHALDNAVWGEPEPQTEEEWEAWKGKMEEETDLFYELRDAVAGFAQDGDDEPDESARGGILGWLFG